LNRSSAGYEAAQFGIATDRTVPADYDGDGKTDLAVYRNGTWYLLKTNDGYADFLFGLDTDIPVPADYDGDGRADISVCRTGSWYIVQSSNGQPSYYQFGLGSDVPIAGRAQ